MSFWSRLFGPDHKPRMGGLEIFKYIGPGLLVTVGFIDPGNWASNLAAGAQYGYTLLWMVTLSTVMLIVLQHNVAHLGIATGSWVKSKKTIETSNKPVYRGNCRCAIIGFLVTCHDFTGCP